MTGLAGWMRRLSGSAEPSFGIVPAGGVAVDYRRPADGVRDQVEFDRQGHRVRAMEYVSMVGAGRSPSLADSLDRTYTIVQLRTPTVPAVELSPRTGAFEPERFTPIEDAVITRLAFGMLRVDATMREVETGTALDRQFAVEAEDPELARAMLSPGVRHLLTTDSWFRTKQIGFSGGALWAMETGGLSQDVAISNSRHLAELAAVVDADAWRAGTTDATEFLDVVRTADTGQRAWYAGVRRNLRAWTNQRRGAKNRLPLTVRGLVIRIIVLALLLVPGAALAVNALTSLAGVAPTAQVRVTASFEGEAGSANCSSCGSNDTISGTYRADGATHVVDTFWMSFTRLPEKGEVVEVSIGPVWWHPVVEAADTAVFLLLLALLPLLSGYWLLRATFFPRPRKPKST